ncbi:hypothetical protein [Microbacterium sp.]|jgi:hypothetical protein|uniref:hypothetical protein n=1 Tax=Microbacterium sp. TaxID=51671 RepID=UPI0037C8B774
MNRSVARASAGGVIALAVVISGCSGTAPSDAMPSAPQEEQALPAFRTAPCNLGEYWDRDALVKRAKYTEPSVGQAGLDSYGPTIANDTCSDAAILKWQELRRELGESDEICRIVWFDDYYSAVTYDIGCAVPVVVTDASR